MSNDQEKRIAAREREIRREEAERERRIAAREKEYLNQKKAK